MGGLQKRNPEITEPFNLGEMVGAMGYLMDWTQRQPPGYIVEMEPEDFINKLKINLVEAGDKVDDLAHKHGEGVRSHPELEFLSGALKKLARGEPVEANPFQAKKEA